jgi:copper chaperone
MKVEKLNIEGMSCGHCTGRVKESLTKLSGVSSVDVDLESATVNFDEIMINKTELETAITDLGYKVKA